VIHEGDETEQRVIDEGLKGVQYLSRANLASDMNKMLGSEQPSLLG
jgi:hypothetical protein